MSLRPIHLLGSPVLRERSAEVGEVDDDVRDLVRDLFDTMHADSGIGLAANQVGMARRVAVVRLTTVVMIVKAQSSNCIAPDRSVYRSP